MSSELPGAKPLPVTVTDCRSCRPAFGVTVKAGPVGVVVVVAAPAVVVVTAPAGLAPAATIAATKTVRRRTYGLGETRGTVPFDTHTRRVSREHRLLSAIRPVPPDRRCGTHRHVRRV